MNDIEYDRDFELVCEYRRNDEFNESDDDNECIDNLERARDMNCERMNIWN